jgi:hypothetical protein
MKNQSILLLISYFMLIVLTTSIVPILQLNAQVPTEQFGITPTCSETEIHVSEKDKNKSPITGEKGKDGFFIYGNASLGYKIEYPKDWKGIQTHCLLKGAGLIQTGSIIDFKASENSSKNGSLGITVKDDIPWSSIDEFIKAYTEDFSSVIESKEMIMIDGKSSVKFMINLGNDIKLEQITILSNDKRYDITHPISSSISNSTIQYMINSFKIFDDEALNSENITELDELG